MWFWVSFVLLGLLVYIPIGVIIYLGINTIVAIFTNGNDDIFEMSKMISGVVIVTVAILAHGGLFGWYDKIEKPDEIIVSVDDEVKNDFYKYEERDSVIYLTVSDKNFSESNESHLTDNGNIRFDIKNANAKKERANLKWTMEIDGKEYERSTLPTGTEIHLLSDDFSLKIGESTVKVKAKNDLGEITKTVVIKKLRTEDECRKEENAGVLLCKKVAEANLADSEKKAEAEAKKQKQSSPSTSNPVYTYETSVLDGTADTTNCDYVKYGKCWDNVLEQAYEDGTLDAWLNEDGFLGYPHYQGCEGVCADIYDDEYWKGYYYYR